MLPVCRTPDDVYALPPFAVTCHDVEGCLDEFHAFHTLFRDCVIRREPRAHFFRSMVGPFSPLERKSLEPIAMQTEASSIRARQRGLSAAQWQAARMRTFLPGWRALSECTRRVQWAVLQPHFVISLLYSL